MTLLTKSETEIMELLWQSDEPITSSQMIEMSDDRTWKKSYVHLLINSLISKDMIEVSGFVKTTKNYARTFSPKISKEEYTVGQFTNMKCFTEEDIPKVVNALILKTENVKVFDELLKIIRKRKSDLK